ncbi:MAG: MGMT family protein [candidate division WOR-3 bacterium]
MSLKSAGQMSYAVMPFGNVSVLWRNRRMVRIELNRTYGRRDRMLEEELAAVLRGQQVPFRLQPDFEALPEFCARVLRECVQVGPGRIATYRELAERVGSPYAARAVGQALAANPFPLVVPCHRVIRSDMRLGGFTGGLHMKRRLLQIEGWRIASGNVVSRS